MLESLSLLDTDLVERQFISIILNEKGAIDLVTIKPEWFVNKKYGKILKYILEDYRSNEVVLIQNIYEKHKDFGELIDTYMDISCDISYFATKNIEKTMNQYERCIIDNYKNKILDELETKRIKREITYKQFIDKVKELDKIRSEDIIVKPILNISDIDTTDEETIKVKSNTRNLDKYIEGFALGELSVWSGSNGSAKSTYLNQLAIESIEQGFNTLIYSGELTSNRLLKWITNQCAGPDNMKFNSEKIYWYTPNDTREKINNWLNDKLYIYNNISGSKANQIINNTKKYIRDHDVKVIFFDNLMSMDLSEYSQDKYEAQSMFVKELSNLAHELGVHIHFVCHPRKSTAFLRKNDISGSADLTNSADNVFIVHRVNEDFKRTAEDYYSKETVERLCVYTNVVEVCKHRETGIQDCFVGMYFEPKSKRLLDDLNDKRKYRWENKDGY